MKTSNNTATTEETVFEKVEALEEIFQAFSRHTVSLQRTYRRLKEQAANLNLELEQTNARLEGKIRELDKVNNFQRSILSSVPVAVVVTDLDGVIRSFNPAAEQIWNKDADDAVGESYRRVLGRHGWLLRSVLAGRTRHESLRRDVEGENRVISSTACLVEDSEGRPIGAVQLDRDVTRLTRMEERLGRQQKLANLGKMAAGLAHEVRKPLNGIKGFASLLRRRFSEDEEGRKYAEHIMDAADRLSRLLARVMGLARPEALDRCRCDLKSQAEQVAEFIRCEDPDRDVHIEIDVPEAARFVMADEDKLKQILLNLMKNAVEASTGSAEVSLTTAEETLDGQRCVHVKIADNGCGMSEETVARMTEPFVSEKDGGAGLGLTVVQRLLRLHDSTLSVSSEPRMGTTMEFTLKPADRTENND